MAEEIYKFDTKETLRKTTVLFPLVLGLLWSACLFCFFYVHKPNYPGFLAWLSLAAPVLVSVVFFVAWSSIRKISYEISSVEVTKKRGDRIISSIYVRDVQSFIAKPIITLKVSGRKDFPFYGIGTKSSRKQLLTVLKQLGIKEVERKKVRPAQAITMAIAGLCVGYYCGSLIMWVVFTSLCLKLFRVGIDWPMFLHLIPAVVFLFMSVTTVWLAYKRKRTAIVLLGLTILASILCFIFEHKNDFYQWEKGKYCTWWLCEVFDKPEKPAINGYVRTYYKYGYIDQAGNIVVEPKYDLAEDFSEGLACVGYRIKKEDAEEEIVERQKWRFEPNSLPMLCGEADSVYLYGFINTKGEVIVEPQFDSAEAFSDGMSLIGIGGKYGYINKNGDIVIEPQFHRRSIADFSEGFAVIAVDKKYTFIDKQGEIAFAERFNYADRFSERLAPVRVESKWGYIDGTAQMVINPQFDDAMCFSEGVAAVKKDDKWGFINKAGDIVVEPQFDSALGFHEDIGIVRLDWEWGLIQKWGCIDKTGRIIIQPRFYYPPKFYGELGRVCYAKGWGYREKYWWEWIDKTGTAVKRPYLNKAYSFSEGLAEVNINDKIGFINQSGEFVIKPQFDSARSFSEGLAAVGLKIANNGAN
jgi:hypothetical protein